MAAVGCLEKEIQFQKEAIKEQDARQAQDMPLTKKYPHPAKNIPVSCHPPETDTPVCRCRMSHRGHPLLAWLRIPAPPGYALPSEGSIGHPCRLLMPCRGPAAVVPPRFRGHPPLLPTRKALCRIPPFPVTGRKHFPQAEDGDLPSTPEKKFYGERGPGEGDAFSKAPSSPGKPPKLPLQKTRLPLPHPRCHLPGRARPGAHRPRRGQASATARAGAP